MTRDQRRVLRAYWALVFAHMRRGFSPAPSHLHRWLFVRWRVHLACDLTGAQARHACRQLNAWRAAVEGRT